MKSATVLEFAVEFLGCTVEKTGSIMGGVLRFHRDFGKFRSGWRYGSESITTDVILTVLAKRYAYVQVDHCGGMWTVALRSTAKIPRYFRAEGPSLHQTLLDAAFYSTREDTSNPDFVRRCGAEGLCGCYACGERFTVENYHSGVYCLVCTETYLRGREHHWKPIHV